MYRNLLNGFRPMYHLRIRAQLKGQGIPVPTDSSGKEKGYFCQKNSHDILPTGDVVNPDYIAQMKTYQQRGYVQWDIASNGNLTEKEYLDLSPLDQLVLTRLRAIRCDLRQQYLINFRPFRGEGEPVRDLDTFLTSQSEDLYDRYYMLNEVLQYDQVYREGQQPEGLPVTDEVRKAALKEYQLDHLQLSFDVQENIMKSFRAINSIKTTTSTDQRNIQYKPAGQAFLQSCVALQEQLIQDIHANARQAERQGKPFEVETDYAYQQLNSLTQMIDELHDPPQPTGSSENLRGFLNDRLTVLQQYEARAKKKSSGWAKFGKSIGVVIGTAVGALAGIVAGAIIGATVGTILTPGAGTIFGIVLGAIAALPKGMAIGAAAGAAVGGVGSAVCFFSRSKEEKKVIKKARDIHQCGRDYAITELAAGG